MSRKKEKRPRISISAMCTMCETEILDIVIFGTARDSIKLSEEYSKLLVHTALCFKVQYISSCTFQKVLILLPMFSDIEVRS